MNTLSIPDSKRRWDCLSLGEVMLRLDPGEGRIHTARQFQVWEGGGEYNVARGLRRCFGLRTAVATALAENPVGRLVEDFILQGGVDTSLIRWIPYDGVGRTVRNGLNFTERGFGVRAAVGCSDRGHTAISQVKTGDFDWESIFGPSERLALAPYRRHLRRALRSPPPRSPSKPWMPPANTRTPISYDLNFRDSLWKSIGGKAKAQEVNRDLVRKVDVLLGNEEDFSRHARHRHQRRRRGLRRVAHRRLRRDAARGCGGVSQPEARGQHAAHRANRQPQRLGRNRAL